MTRHTRRAALAAVTLLAGLAGLTAAPEPAAALCLAPEIASGTYRNIDPNTRGVTTVRLGPFTCGDTVLNGRIPPTGFPASMWGSCSPSDCRFPDTFLRASRGDMYSGTIDQGYARRTIFIAARGPGQIRLTLRTDFTDPGRRDYSATYVLAR